MQKWLYADKKGFSLIEVLIATTILAISIVAGLTAYISGEKYVKAARTRDAAYMILTQEAEELLSMDFNYLSGQSYYSFSFDGTGANLNKTGSNVIISCDPNDLLSNAPYKAAHFDPHGLKGAIRVYISKVNGSNDNLLDVKIVLCYQIDNVIVGEDKNLNGSLEIVEDSDSDGEIDSPLTLNMSISRIGV